MITKWSCVQLYNINQQNVITMTFLLERKAIIYLPVLYMITKISYITATD